MHPWHDCYLDEHSVQRSFPVVIEVPKGSKNKYELDKETGLPLWQVAVLDPDPEASARDKTVIVKLVAQHQPVPPENKSGLPFTPVRFTGLTVTPWVDDKGPKAKLAYSLRATGFADPTATPSTRDQGKGA